MAVVHPLRPVAAEPRGDSDRVNVVPLVEVLGPISPELVLVDPELAPRARALLPELAWNWQPGTREHDEPIPLRLAAPPAARRFPWRLATVAAVGSVALAFFGLGWSTAATSEDEPVLQSRPPVAAPAAPAPVAPAPAPEPQPPTASTTRPSGSKPKPNPQPPAAAPRFVWPAEPNANGYRLALFQDGRRVFERDIAEPALQLPKSWTFDGRLERLTRGTYRWVVWPTFGPAKRLGPAIVSAQYAV